MRKEIKKVPTIRFRGFTEDWEQHKVSDIAGRYDNLRVPVSSNKRVHGTTPYYGANGVQDYVDGYTHDGEYILIAEDGANDLQNYPVHYVNGRIWVNNHAHVLQGKTGIADTKFLSYAFSQIDISSLLVGGGRAKLNADVLMKLDLLLPEHKEQEKLGNYFSHIDSLIALHQRKLDQLKKLKKYFLQNMFPAKGEKVPRIRFKGFTGDWEQRKLSEMVIRYEDPIVTPHDGYTRLGIRSHAKGTFYEYVAPGHELETAQMHRVAADKLIFNITFAWEHAVAITTKDDAGKLVSHRFPQFTLSESLRPEFLKYIILDEGFHHNLYLASPGGAGRNRVLKIDEALDYPICFPSFEEQHKIGEFLNKLSNLIALHQRKLDQLQTMKKFMLQNMFI